MSERIGHPTTFMLDTLSNWGTGGMAALAFGTALLAALVVTPPVSKLAWRCGALARPDARRLHPEPIAQWGGLAVFSGVAFAVLLWGALRQPTAQDVRAIVPSVAPAQVEATVRATAQSVSLTAAFLGCGLLMLLLGMADDRFELSPPLKFGAQAAIVYALWLGGVRIHTLPFSSGTQNLQDWQSLALTMFWVLGLTNGVNLIDGVDGLAAGVCAIGAGSLCLIELNKGATWSPVAAAAVCGASIGFLRYNSHPARIFLGDAGALLLGFWLATIAVAAAAKTAAATTLALPLLVMGVPVLDTLWAVVRRTLAGQPLWRADRGHLHHRLLARGFSPQKTVLLIYAISAALGAVAVVWTQISG